MSIVQYIRGVRIIEKKAILITNFLSSVEYSANDEPIALNIL